MAVREAIFWHRSARKRSPCHLCFRSQTKGRGRKRKPLWKMRKFGGCVVGVKKRSLSLTGCEMLALEHVVGARGAREYHGLGESERELPPQKKAPRVE